MVSNRKHQHVAIIWSRVAQKLAAVKRQFQASLVLEATRAHATNISSFSEVRKVSFRPPDSRFCWRCIPGGTVDGMLLPL